MSSTGIHFQGNNYVRTLRTNFMGELMKEDFV